MIHRPAPDDRDGPKWGVEVPVCLPNPMKFDGVDIKKVDPCLIRTTTALLLEALGNLLGRLRRGRPQARGGRRSRDQRLGSGRQGRWQEVLPPAPFKILGFVAGLEDRFEGEANAA